MRPARMCGALAMLSLAGLAAGGGCAANSDASGSPPTGQGGSGAGSGGSAGGAMCAVAITTLIPASPDDLRAGPAAVLRVRGSVSGVAPASFTWEWRATFADGQDLPVRRPQAGDPSVVQIVVARAGTYTLSVALGGGGFSCRGERTVAALQPGGRLASFRLHVTPPAGSDLPAQDLERQVVGGTPSGGNTLALSPGIAVPIEVRAGADGAGGGGARLGAYVLLTEVTTGATVEARARTEGAAVVRVPAGRYQMLVVPDGDLAPVALPARSATLIEAPVVMDPGPEVTGTVTDAAGAPVAGATVVLRAGALPSTRGTSDAAGAFRLRARPGTFGVTVAAPVAGGAARLEAALAEVGGVTVAAAGAGPAAAGAPPLRIRLTPPPAGRAVIDLVAADARSLGPDARVTLESTAPLERAATLAADLGAGATASERPLAGRVRASLRPDAAGHLSADGLPAGTYRVTASPGASDTRDAVTVGQVDVAAATSAGAAATAALRMPLASKVTVRGQLLPGDAAAGVRVLVVDDEGLPFAAATSAGPSGAFSFAVSPRRRYALSALPRPEQPLARTLFPRIIVGTADVDVAPRAMPDGLPYAGRVVDPSLAGVGGALVQAFCVACAEPEVPVAEAVTASDGFYQLMLPDPGVTP